MKRKVSCELGSGLDLASVLGPRQLELRLPGFQGASETGRIWLLAADRADTAQITEHLISGDAGRHSGFLISVFDGSYAVRAGDIVMLRQGVGTHVFRAGSARDDWSDDIAMMRVRECINDARPTVSDQRAAEVLFVRLAGNGLPVPGRDADSMLARTLRSLQEADQATEARFVAETAGNMLERLTDASSGAVEGVLSRLRAGALFALCRSLFGYSSDLLGQAADLYLQAGLAFEQADLHAQAASCQRYARVLGDLMRRNSGEEPPLPGIADAADPEPVIPRLAFRALRCLAIPIGPQGTSPGPKVTALGFRQIGALSLGDTLLRRLVDEVESLNVIPRITVTRVPGRRPTRRVRVDFDREHFALLGIEDRRTDLAGPRFSVVVRGDGWSISPSVQFTGPGSPAKFLARSDRPTGAPLEVMIAAGADVGTFEVPTSV